MRWAGGAAAGAVLGLLGYACGTLCHKVIGAVASGRGAQVRVGVAVALGVMSTWSYLVASFRASYWLQPTEAAEPYRTVKRTTGTARWCSKCKAYKPDRCHHCRKCARCVLRMDHHCPWVWNTCIGLRNYHAFILFLVYASTLCVYTLGTLGWAFQQLRRTRAESIPVSWMVLGTVALLVGGGTDQFATALVPFTGFHIYLTSVNQTTLEYMEGTEPVRPDAVAPRTGSLTAQRLGSLLARTDAVDETTPLIATPRRRRLYDRGVRENWAQVLGPSPWLWWAPVQVPACDGVYYKVNTDAWTAAQDALRARRA